MVQDYVFPRTVEDAVALLAEGEGKARILAGGTDLVLDAERLPIPPTCFVDLRDVPGLDGIDASGGRIMIGAKTTHAVCSAHPLIQQHAPALAQACATVGSTQIRNIATLAGNVVSANPAADAAVVLTALQAVCTVRTPAGTRQVPLQEAYQGVGRSAMDSSRELVTHLHFPAASPGFGSAYQRISQRKGLSLPMVCAAVTLQIDGKVIADATIVAAPLAPGPTRITQAEAFLIGRVSTEDVFAQAAQLAASCVQFRSSAVRGSAAYRGRVLPVLIRRALLTAAQQANTQKGGTSCR